jgi:hypothetical protein
MYVEPMEVKLWVYMRNNGDGSSSPEFYNTEFEAEDAAKGDDERNTDDVLPVTLKFDDNGKLLNPG